MKKSLKYKFTVPSHQTIVFLKLLNIIISIYLQNTTCPYDLGINIFSLLYTVLDFTYRW